jgi:hypothetical protein
MKQKDHSENVQSSSTEQNIQQQRSILWIGLVLFISGWMFFLGVLVGRRTSPALLDYKKVETELAALSKTFANSKKAQIAAEKNDMALQTELDYADELKKKSMEDISKIQPAPQEKPFIPAEAPKPAPQMEAVLTPLPALSTNAKQPASRQPSINTAPKQENSETPPDSIASKTASTDTKVKSMYDLKSPGPKESTLEYGSTAATKSGTERPQGPAKSAPEHKPLTPPKSKTERVASTSPQPQPDHASSPAKPAPEKTLQPPQAKPAAAESTANRNRAGSVHVTEFVDKKSADAMVERLRKKGIQAAKTAKMIPGKGIWYSVDVGSSDTSATVNRLKQENLDASVVSQ